MSLLLFLINAALVAATGASSNISVWVCLRGTQIQTKLVLEGGTLFNGIWSDGQWLNMDSMDSTYGFYYQIDLRKSFNAENDSIDSYMANDLTATLQISLEELLFNNGYQFYTFGGLADTESSAGQSTVTLGKVNQSSASTTRWRPGLSVVQIPDIGGDVNQSNYIVDGSYTSMSDQERGYLFSGMVGENGGYVRTMTGDNATDHPTITNTSFIRVNMTIPDKVSFDYLRWPDDLVARAQGALVWIPYGTEGTLIAIGGIQMPADEFLIAPETINGDRCMTELAVYDIANDAWHVQPTTGPDEQPRQTAKFCTAIVATEDGNSQEIFVYGGYSGTDNDTDVRDDVWVLSVPAFHWTRLTTPERTSPHGRYGNVCFTPNPSTFITVGDSDYMGSPMNSKLIVDVLDLNSGAWTSKYNSSSDVPFRASTDLQQRLQWDSASGPGEKYTSIDFLNSSALNTLFQTRYSGQITMYWPYSEVNSEEESNSSDRRTVIIATTCTIIPLILLALLAVFRIRCRRRNTRSLARSQQSRRSVFSWLGKDPIDPEPEKSTISDDTAVGSNVDYNEFAKTRQNEIYEAPSNGNVRG